MESLESRGQMTPIGRAKIVAAMADGSWSLLDAIKRLEKPAALVEAMKADAQGACELARLPAVGEERRALVHRQRQDRCDAPGTDR